MKVMGDKNMREVFKEFNNDIFQMRAATSSTQVGDQIAYEITKPDGKLEQITESQYKAITTLAGIVPATAVGAGGTPFLFKQEARPSEAPAAGAPTKDALAEARKVFGVGAPAATPAPAATQAPPAGIPATDWEKLTPAERERIMTERIRGAIGTGVGAVMRGGEAILRGARAIR